MIYTNPQHYQNIAAAIREKLGVETTYKPAQMAAAIRSIETQPEIEPLTVTENGTYTAPEGVDGYAPVTVNVEGGDSVTTLTNDDMIVRDGFYINVSSSSMTVTTESGASFIVFDLTAHVGKIVNMHVYGGNRQRIAFTKTIPSSSGSFPATSTSQASVTYSQQNPFVYSNVYGYARAIPTDYPYLVLYTSNMQTKSHMIPVEIKICNL